MKLRPSAAITRWEIAHERSINLRAEDKSPPLLSLVLCKTVGALLSVCSAERLAGSSVKKKKKRKAVNHYPSDVSPPRKHPALSRCGGCLALPFHLEYV